MIRYDPTSITSINPSSRAPRKHASSRGARACHLFRSPPLPRSKSHETGDLSPVSVDAAESQVVAFESSSSP
ncbi:hypothetical protein HBH69_037310 [Parastagonospora nodorum]|nr:hypothetical protein HBH49_074300 [Parastagonospora nodorum]KAH5160641.1 hypothetical protein HBH69_037310 [Parastagonospora nodorum]KAH5924311.1 hypothetical protein HBI88_124860 [Parastagonospora nodorum]KAH6012267.1 hypothetical protein HBI84_027100 [Parastagonospora nodorum]